MRTSNLILVMVGILCLFLVKEGCNQQSSKDALLAQLKNSEQVFKVKVAKDSSTIATQNQTIMSERDAYKAGILKLQNEIQVAQSQVKQEQEIKYVNKSVPYVPDNYIDTAGWYVKLKNGDSSKANIDSLISNSIIVPKKFALKEKWFNISGSVKKDGLLIDTLKIKNESTVTIGWKKTGFLWFGRKPLVEIENSNPYLSLSRVSNVVIEKKKGLLSSPFFWMAVGVLGGHFLIK